uniref:NADH dehydrogenase [ubiquinone] 1 beta subcomplex subunit 11, mitochondrial n=1 Tax=Strongyloides papillosus TaxID=174720 RepID=A0A0N5BFY4_STREA
MLKCGISCKSSLVRSKVFTFRSLASHGHSDNDPSIVRKSADYKPGSDSYAYENPYPKLNGGRLDWLFGDGWRRPLAKDQGGKMRREWIWFGQVSHDEYKDWLSHHKASFLVVTFLTVWTTCWLIWMKPDWPSGREWALREAHLEMARREKAGLPYISKDFVDPKRVAASLPSDEELRDFEILV